MRIGFHISITASISAAVDRSIKMGINTFQIFTRNPRSWNVKPLNEADVAAFKKNLTITDIDPVIVHMPYLPNLASPRIGVYERSIRSLITELGRCNTLGVPFLVTHLGSHLGLGKAAGLKRIVEAINTSLSTVSGKTMLLLENTAGTRNSMGSSFEDIQNVIDGITYADRVGVCFDTCHAFAAGYDLTRRQAVDKALTLFDSLLGLDRLKLVHLNDSVAGLRSRLDRHDHIGLGKIGDAGFRAILQSEFGHRPLILETPIDERRSDFENLMKVRELGYP